jgi:hypothetical protein
MTTQLLPILGLAFGLAACGGPASSDTDAPDTSDGADTPAATTKSFAVALAPPLLVCDGGGRQTFIECQDFFDSTVIARSTQVPVSFGSNPLDRVEFLNQPVTVSAYVLGSLVAQGSTTISGDTVRNDQVIVTLALPESVAEGSVVSLQASLGADRSKAVAVNLWSNPQSVIFGDRLRVTRTQGNDGSDQFTFTKFAAVTHKQSDKHNHGTIVTFGPASSDLSLDQAVKAAEYDAWSIPQGTSALDMNDFRMLTPTDLMAADTLELRLYEDYDWNAELFHGGDFKSRYCFKSPVTADGTSCAVDMECPLEPAPCPM